MASQLQPAPLLNPTFEPSDTANHPGCLELPAKAERIARAERRLAVFPTALDRLPEQQTIHKGSIEHPAISPPNAVLSITSPRAALATPRNSDLPQTDTAIAFAISETIPKNSRRGLKSL